MNRRTYSGKFLEGLTYSDVLIAPAYSAIESRLDINIDSTYLGRPRTPIISAPMDTVSGPEMVVAMYQNNAYGVLHRFGTPEELTRNFWEAYSSKAKFGVSIGVKDFDSTKLWLNTLGLSNIHSICIDVAHGHHQLVVDTITKLREFEKEHDQDWWIIAGNVATGIGYYALAKAGADAVRVGIGPGSACTTRETTGIGVPQLTALLECARMRHDYKLRPSIIADGGIQVPGDIAKALAAGADAVMLGKMLAGADEANIIKPPQAEWSLMKYQQLRYYRGQSTVGSNGTRGAPEGIGGLVKPTGPVKDTLDQLMHYLRSSMSYVGARNLKEFREKAEFIKVSSATHLESAARLGV